MRISTLFALSTAKITLKTELGLRSAGAAAVVFKPLSAGEFSRAETEIDELLSVVAQSAGSKVRRRSDTFGFEWLVVRDPDFEDLVITVHLVSSELQSRGFGGQPPHSLSRSNAESLAGTRARCRSSSKQRHPRAGSKASARGGRLLSPFN